MYLYVYMYLCLRVCACACVVVDVDVNVDVDVWSSSRVKSVNTRGRGPGGHHPHDWRRFWTLVSLSRVEGVKSHRDRGGLVAKRRTVVTFGRASCCGMSKMSSVTGIGEVPVTKHVQDVGVLEKVA